LAKLTASRADHATRPDVLNAINRPVAEALRPCTSGAAPRFRKSNIACSYFFGKGAVRCLVDPKHIEEKFNHS
jgi:hypothetical protein